MTTGHPEEKTGYLSTHPSLNAGVVESKRDWLRDILADAVPSDRSARMLEIGPGNGEALMILTSEMGFEHVHAIDISAEVVTSCQGISGATIELVEDTGAFLGDRGNTFDFVLMYHVLEHFPSEQVMEILKAIRGSLKSDGLLLVGVPNAASPIIGVEQQTFDFTHRTAFLPWSLEQAHRMAGFTRCKVMPVWPPKRGIGRFLQRSVQKILLAVARQYMRAFVGINRPILTHSMVCHAWK